VEEASVDAVSLTVATGFGHFFARIGRKMREIVDPLTDDELWTRPLPYGNSIGHLLLHLTGNLSYYCGTVIGKTGYVRDRPLEFTDASRPSKETVMRAFEAALTLARETAAAQSPADWGRPFEAEGAEDMPDRFSAFLRCAAHADRHTGQIVYLRKQLDLAARR
jgi:hypothetical protein